MGRIFVFGSMNMDLSIQCPRMPRAGETLMGSDFITNPGGKGANQALSCQLQGADTTMIGAVGADGFGQELLEGLESAGVNMGGVETLKDVSTGVAVIVRSEGDNRIVLDPGANHGLHGKKALEYLRSHGKPGDGLLVQFECPLDLVCAMVHEAHGLGMWTLVNPAPAQTIPSEAYGTMDLLCLNESECELLCGILPDTPEKALEAARYFSEKGVGKVLITLGSTGSFGYEQGTTSFVPAASVEARDTTAAGDTYIGALSAALSRGEGFFEAMVRATAASALCVTRVGAQRSIPSAEETDGFLAGPLAPDLADPRW